MKFRNRSITDTAPDPPQDTSGPPGRTHRRRTVAVAAAITAAGLGLTAVAASGAFAGTQTTTRAGGALAWSSGVYLPNATPKTVAAYGTWRGAPVSVATVWPNRSSWNDIVNPAWLYQIWKGAPQTVAFTEPMLPEGVAGVSLAACAAGSYNSYWKKFGTNISAYGLGKSIIRLGWEFNGNWYIWQASNPSTWVKCWQQIVTSARTTAPGLQWDWNVNRGKSAGLSDPALAYPGNAYVNTVGVDSYDSWPAATTSANWNQQLNGTQGLMYWYNFATVHGKKFAAPEWGNMMPGTTAPGSHAGGDNPAYVNDMLGFFRAHSANIAWESNFQGPSTGGVYGAGTRVPEASAAYQAGF
jgi:Glycosyl hydrolase family 26